MGEKVNINSRSINLALSHSFDEPKTARYRSPFFNGSSIIGFYLIERKVKVSGLLESLEIMNYAYCRLSIVARHFFPYKLQSLLNNRRRI